MQRLRRRSPLLYALCAWIGGTLLAAYGGESAVWGMAIFGLLSGIALRRLRSLGYLGGIALIAGMVFLWRAPGAIDPERVPREMEVGVQVLQVFRSKNPERSTGIVSIQTAPLGEAEIIGQLMYVNILGEMWSGEHLRLRGVLEPWRAQGSFGDYLARKRVHLRLRGVRVLEHLPMQAWQAMFGRAKAYYEEALRLGASNRGPWPVYTAMLLGERRFLDREQETLFQESGSLHLFAVSGLHIACIAGVLAFLLRLVPMSDVWRGGLGIAILGLYVAMIGAPASAVRAFLMIALYWGAYCVKRKPCPWSALVVSAWIALLWNPLVLWEIGFELSYLVVASILLLGVPLHARWMRAAESDSWVQAGGWRGKVSAWLKRLGSSILLLLCVSLSASLMSAPLGVLYFGAYTPGAPLMSLFLIPMASLAVAGGFISLLLASLHLSWLVEWVNMVVYRWLDCMLWLLEGVLPYASGFRRVEGGSAIFWWLWVIAFLGILVWAHVRDHLEGRWVYGVSLGMGAILSAYLLIA